MGFAGSLNWGSYLGRGWSVPRLVTYMESHDEQRMVVNKKDAIYRVSAIVLMIINCCHHQICIYILITRSLFLLALTTAAGRHKQAKGKYKDCQ